MMTNLKDAKARLSEYLELVEGGEEVVITVRGKAKARLCPVQKEPSRQELEVWGERLEEARGRYAVKGKRKSPADQEIWDELRDERA